MVAKRPLKPHLDGNYQLAEGQQGGPGGSPPWYGGGFRGRSPRFFFEYVLYK